MNYTKKTLLCSILLIKNILNAHEETSHDMHTITVFIHGTFALKNFVHHTPFRPLVYCKEGLNLASTLPKEYHFHQIATHCVQDNPILYAFDRFYIFGWDSEHISHQTRLQAAQRLTEGLQKVVKTYYAKYCVIPKIQLIGFSHGGNVILNTAHYLPLYIDNQEVSIEVWLFGTPVQTVNQHLINSAHFKKVYSIYSEKDWLQRMDPQGLYSDTINFKKLWSDRMFKKTDHCMQINFTVNGKSIAHSYYRYIFKHLTKIQSLTKQQARGKNRGLIAVNLEIK